MLKKCLAAMAAVLMAFSFVGCSREEPAESGKTAVKLTFLNSRKELQEGLKQIAKTYKEKIGVEIDILEVPADVTPAQRFTQLHEAGTPPTMALLDAADVAEVGWEKAVDLTGESWVADAGDHVCKVNGRIYSFPLGVEGRGLIYNKTTLERVLGEAFDPSAYNTLDKLKDLFARLKEKGMETPVILSKEDWSLGGDYFGLQYLIQSEKPEENAAYIEKLKKGEVDLKADERFKQLMDTFDLLREHNKNGKAPLDAKYEEDPSHLVNGDAAFWFGGSGAWSSLEALLKEDNHDEYGLMALPIGSDADDFANTTLLGVTSRQILIDKTKADNDQQMAAKEFLRWLVYDEEGQKAMTDTLRMVPAFKNIDRDPVNPLGAAVKDFIKAGKTALDAILPSDHGSSIGAAMQDYLSGNSNREDLAAKVQEYWTGKAGEKTK